MENRGIVIQNKPVIICQKHIPRYEVWTGDDDKVLLKDFNAGIGISEMAEKYKRTSFSIEQRLAMFSTKDVHDN